MYKKGIYLEYFKNQLYKNDYTKDYTKDISNTYTLFQ